MTLKYTYKEVLIWCKTARVIMQLSETLETNSLHALTLFYSTKVCDKIHNPNCKLYLMSDSYIVEDIIEELRGR